MKTKISFITFAALALCFLTASCVKESEFDDRVSDIVKVQLDTLNRKVASLEAVQELLAADVELMSADMDSISDDVEDLSERCDSLTSSIEDVKNEIQEEHKWTEGELSAIEARIDGIAEVQKKFKEDVDTRLGRLENRIQEVDIVPEYSDGSASISTYRDKVLSFIIRPESVAEELVAAHPTGDSVFRILAKQVLTKSSVTFDTLNVKNVSYEGGVVSVTVNGAKLDAKNSYSACLVVNDGNSETASGFFPVTVESIGNVLYCIGTTNSWDIGSQKQRIVRSDDTSSVFSGFIYLRPDSLSVDKCLCRFLVNENTFDGALDYTSFAIKSENIVEGKESHNLQFTEGEGVYLIEMTLDGGNIISATKINNMNLVGDFNGWDATDTNQRMTWNPENLCWEKYDAGVDAKGWKFTANDGWKINLGGVTDNLYQNGENLTETGQTILLFPTRIDNGNIFCTVIDTMSQAAAVDSAAVLW